MNKFFISFVASLMLLFTVSCSNLLHKNGGIFGKASKAEDVAAARIEKADSDLSKSDQDRLTHIGTLAQGTDYSLKKLTNAPREAVVAGELNERVIALANKPNLDEVKEIRVIVDKLLSQVESERKSGEKALAGKDKEIEKLQRDIANINVEKDKAIKSYMALADANAAKADQYQATLKQMDSFFGLGAVFYGLKKFIISAAWVLGIGSILFLVLRLLSTANPIAGAVFGIFDMIGSWFVHIIQVIVPKAVSMAGNVSSQLFNSYKSTMTKLVDAIQMAKANATAAGKVATLQDVLDEASKSMNDEEKAIVDELKKALQWK